MTHYRMIDRPNMTFLGSFQKLLDESRISRPCLDPQENTKTGFRFVFDPSFSKLFVRINQMLQNHLKSNRSEKGNEGIRSMKFSAGKEKGSIGSFEIDLEKQLQAWRDDPSWFDEPPVVKLNTQNGSLCRLNIEVNVGLPPDAAYDIFTDPDNQKYFRNIKISFIDDDRVLVELDQMCEFQKNISRRVLIDKGPRQLVEVEQAAAWKFLWWSGTFPVHLLVDQNRKDHSSNYKQCETRFMKTFEGCWRVEPLFVDEHLCSPFKPETWEEYCSCTGGRGRIGSKVIMEQMFQPSALLTPPPISWYVRGITVRTTETMIEDLVAEAAKIRGEAGSNRKSNEEIQRSSEGMVEKKFVDIKERWKSRRKGKKKYRKCY